MMIKCKNKKNKHKRLNHPQMISRIMSCSTLID
jgi:hypothetical protein